MNNKSKNIITLLYVVTFIILLIGATFSYFTETEMTIVSPKVEAKSATRNRILFETINKIEIYPNASNFKIGEESLFSTVNAKVHFTHSKTDPITSDNYDIILNIDKNNLEYSTEEKTPELILKVTGPDGELTEIDGLTYTTVSDNKGENISGFDITEFKDEVAIIKNKEISSASDDESEKIDDWQITVIYVNLGVNQNINYDKELNGTIQVKRTKVS